MELLATLKSIRDNGPKSPTTGICYNVLALTGCSYDEELKALFVKWDEFNGDPDFPIRSYSAKRGHEYPSLAYLSAQKRKSLWTRRSAYGRARWRLLNHCIKTLESFDPRQVVDHYKGE